MTAKEKFEARLNFLGLADEWSEIGGTGSVGTFDPYGNIIVLIHLSNDDEYSEIRYPSYASLRENDKFVDVCAHKCVTLDNDLDFATKTARWLLRITDECPLDAVDAYTILEDYGFNEYYEDFEDDVDEEKEEGEYQANIQKYSEFCGWALSTLSYIRATLYDAVRMELARGHNLPDNYSVENGQDYFHDYSFCYVNKEEVVEDKGFLYVKCTENGSFFTIPFDSLHEKTILDIYESMK